MRALGVTSQARMTQLPEVLPIGDTLPGYEAIAWNGLVAPAGTPDDVVATLNASVLRALADPGLIRRFADLGATTHATTPKEFGDYVSAQIVKWGAVVRQSGAKVD